MPQEHPDLPNRHSMRLPTYDYRSSGAYFVTICTENRQRFFTQPDLHPYLLEIWHLLPQQFPGIELDEFVIMPDHLHFIIWLDLLFRLISRQAACRLDSCVFHKMWLAWLPALLRKNLV